MGRPDKALIVTLLVPATAADGSDRGEWGGAVGTGCALDKGLILTSRHLVQRANRNPAHPIKVRWYALRIEGDPCSAWVDLDPDDKGAIRWVGEGNLDAALLVCPRHQGLTDIPAYRLAADPPTGLLQWESRGFPKASMVKGHSGHGEFHGKVMSMGRGDSLFTVSSELKAGDRRGHWSGASGMPVLVGDTIIGVVKDVPDNFENRTLRVVPAFLLRRQRDFLEVIGTNPPELLDRARELIVRALRRSEEATWSLKHHLAVECGSLAPCREVLAEKALYTPLRELVNTVLQAKEKLLQSGDHKGAEVVTELVLAVLPTGTDPAKVADIGPTVSGSRNALIRLDVHSPTVAEILMAAADRRGACFRTLHRPQDTLVGEGALGHVLEGGARSQRIATVARSDQRAGSTLRGLLREGLGSRIL